MHINKNIRTSTFEIGNFRVINALDAAVFLIIIIEKDASLPIFSLIKERLFGISHVTRFSI